ncbi:MAG: cupin domain-containing protein [Pseudohongiellaceae bacterium]
MKQAMLKLVLLSLFSFTLASVAADGPPMTVALPELQAGQEMLVLEINLEPGQGSAPHRHNAHVFVYVLEGKINMQVAGEEMVTLSPGDMFYEDPTNIHMVSKNASDTETAKFLVHMVRTAGTPVSIPIE